MTKLSTTTSRTLLAAAVTALLVLVCGLAISSAQTANPRQLAQQIGRTAHTPPPDCSRSGKYGNCGAIGKTTAIQVRADGKQFPTRAAHDGKIVAYSVDLGRPNKEARAFFGDKTRFGSKRFGAAATVRLAILKRQGKNRSKFKLKRQSPTAVLSKSAFGHRYFVTLDRPLRITKGLYVGLTVPTWISNIQGKFPNCPDVAQCPDDKLPPGFERNGNQWLSSRSSEKCNSPFNVAPQQKVGSTRTYGCKFVFARVLYKALYLRKK